MPQKWAIELSVEGDLRFLSHHDMMRAMERLARRAKLPLKYSQGFNPRPVMSLIPPRPVGVASRSDLLVLGLEHDVQPEQLLESLNQTAPAGLRARKACLLVGASPRAKCAKYELDLGEDRLPAVRDRLAELDAATAWPFQRNTAGKNAERNAPTVTTEIDLRGLVQDLRLDGRRLQMTLTPRGDVWARPSEVLAMLGLDQRADLAKVVRTNVDYGLPNESGKG